MTAPERWRLGPDFVPKGRYIDPEFLALECEKLFPRTWQPACRVDELRSPGAFVSYDIGDDSAIVVRTEGGEIAAHHNVCRHRATRLVRGQGRVKEFRCSFHGWRYALDGACTFQYCEDEFMPRDDAYRALQPVRCDTWGGWVFVNFDLDAEPLLEALDPLPTALAPFALERMRTRWHKRTVLPGNWKTALDAFLEGYHTPGSHPQYVRMDEGSAPSSLPAEPGLFRRWAYSPSTPLERHSRFVYGASKTADGWTVADAPADVMANQVQYHVKELKALATERDGRAAELLRGAEIPTGKSAGEVYGELRAKLAAEDGIDWPAISGEQMMAGIGDWHVFPTMVILVDTGCLLGYRSRPNGNDPDSCIFEAFSLELVSGDEAPPAEIEELPDWRAHDGWGQVLSQDFRNLAEVTAGLHSRSFEGHWLNTEQEGSVYNAHVLADRFLFDGA